MGESNERKDQSALTDLTSRRSIDGRSWIVLINKTPRGPLNAEEINTLLSQQILRRNDIAYLVSQTKGVRSEWKLLWQYPEFDRRLGEAPKIEPVLSPSERRKVVPPKTLSRLVENEIPKDLLNIRPEELLPKSTGSKPWETLPLNETESGTMRSEFRSSRTPMLAGLGTAVAVALWLFGGKIFSPAAPPQTAQLNTQPQAPATQPPRPIQREVEAPKPEPVHRREAFGSGRGEEIIADEGEVEPPEETRELAEEKPRKKKKVKADESEDDDGEVREPAEEEPSPFEEDAAAAAEENPEE